VPHVPDRLAKAVSRHEQQDEKTPADHIPDKGKVEQPFRYIREDFFLACSFRNLDDLNAQLRHCSRGGETEGSRHQQTCRQ